jgi:mannose-1-phosphate guanylyltransferase
LRETFERVLPLVGLDRILVVTGADLVEAIATELPELPLAHILAEPEGRNTAPCAALGIGVAERIQGPGPVALLPADHWIPESEVFRQQLLEAFHHAANSGLAVTIGIPPTRPETGYGYLEVAEDRPEGPLNGKRFVEKPDLPTARTYLTSGRHFWNSGIFIWESRSFAKALAQHLPAVAKGIAGPLESWGQRRFPEDLAAAYQDFPSISLDYGVMERLPTFAVYKAGFRWSDLGSWDAWGKLAPELRGKNRGRTQLHSLDSKDNVIFAPEKTVAFIGVNDLIVVDTPDALLVCHADQAQRIREMTKMLVEADRRDLL